MCGISRFFCHVREKIEYTVITIFGSVRMKRVCGFALFWVAAGMLLDMILSSIFIEIVIIIVCLLLGYLLFCC